MHNIIGDWWPEDTSLLYQRPDQFDLGTTYFWGMDEDSAIVRWFDSGRRELVLLKNVGIAAGEDPGAGVKVGSFVTVNERGDSRGVVLEVRSRKRRRLPGESVVKL